MRLFIYFIFYILSVHSSFSQHLIGRVVNAADKSPVEAAVVQFLDIHTGVITNSQGVFNYSGLLPRNCKIKISAIGYEPLLKIYDSKSTDTLLILLEQAHLDLNEVTVSSAGVIQKYTISNVESKSINELNNIQTTNLGEALSNIAGVYNTSTGNGISKPVIRGLSGMRVVTYLNGLRIENQQWGGDHGMGVTENGIGSVEVIKGPSALLYGADALGGVVYFLDENYAKQNHLEIFLESQFETNSMRTKNFTGIKWSKNNFRANVFGGYSNNADYQLPNKLYVKNSRFSENNIKAALGYNKDRWVVNLRYNYVNNIIGLPGHTHDSVIVSELFQAKSQSRIQSIPLQFIANHYTLIDNVFYFDKSELKVLIGNTINMLSEFEDKVTIPALKLILNNYAYNTFWRKSFGPSTHFIIGAQGMYQTNTNSPEALDALIPNSSIIDNGAYGILKSEFKKWEWETGFRIDNRMLKSFTVFNGNDPINKSYIGYNYSLGVSRSDKYFKYRANISSGYRPPHLSELLSNGVHHGTLRYEVGMKNLKSEIATQADVGVEFVSEHLSIIVNPFYNQIKNYIYVTPQDSLVEGLPLFNYTQTNNAWLYGGDIGFHYHPHFAHRFHLESSYSYVRAEDQSGFSLPLIPQARVNSSVRYEFKSRKIINVENVSLQHLYFFEQNKIAVYETRSRAYHVVNFGANIKLNFKTPLHIKIGMKNILNESYIDHLSRLKNIGLAAPGRNFYCTVKINLNKSITNQSKKTVK